MASKIIINLDTSRDQFVVTKCKQNDDITLEAYIYENGAALNLSSKSITIQALKADKTYIIQNTNITKENNKIIANLDRDFTRAAGKTEIEILLVESGKQNTTFSFVLEVVGSVIKGAVESSNTVTILEELDNKIVEAGQVKEETEQLIQSGGAATTGDIANINAQLAEIEPKVEAWNDFKNNGGTIGGSVEVDAIKNKTTVSTGGKTKTLYSGNLNNIDPSFGLEVVDDKTGYDTKVEVVQPGNPTSGGQGYFGSSHDLSTNLGSDTKRWKDVWVGDFLKAHSGYTKLPNGFILQWGTYYSTTIPINGVGGGTISYPIQFPNACINLILTPDLHARGANYALDARLTSDITTSKSNFEFVFINDSSSTWGGLFYIAIGY